MATSAWGQDLHLMIGSIIDAANVSKLPNLIFWYAIVLQYLQPQCGHMFGESKNIFFEKPKQNGPAPLESQPILNRSHKN